MVEVEKKRMIRAAWFYLGVLAMLAGCGDTVGSGACGGAEVNGVCVTIDKITPVYLDAELISVDVVRDLDCGKDGSTTVDDIEPYETHQADVVLSSVVMPTSDPDTVPTFATLTQYRIDYVLNPGPVSGPTLTSRTYDETIKLNTGTTGNRFRVFMFDLDSKDEYNGDPGTHPSYTANYTFTGEDSAGKGITLHGSVAFEIGDFDYCP